MRQELCHTQLMNEELQRELHQVNVDQGPPTCPEQIHLTSSVKDIALGRQTGGYHEDRAPGDEALQVVLEPRDCDGHAIKAAGMLRVQALEISPDGLKKPLSTWDVPPEQLRRTWKSGLWSNGYYVILPWQTWPTTEKLRVVAQFVLTDGRVFEADKDVTLHLAPANSRKPANDTLPAPRSVEPEKPADGPELSPAHLKQISYLSDAVHLGRPEKP